MLHLLFLEISCQLHQHWTEVDFILLVKLPYCHFYYLVTAARTDPLNGDLLSVICHRGEGSNFGHVVSYHKVTGQWYLNDDDRLYQGPSSTEDS